MKLSELIEKYGYERVLIQSLDDCALSLDMNKRGTTIKFGTNETISLDGLTKLGLVLWFDRERVAEIVAASKNDSNQQTGSKP